MSTCFIVTPRQKASYASLAYLFFFFSSRRRHTRYWRDWSSDVCSSDLTLRPSAVTRSFCPCRAGVGSPLSLASLFWAQGRHPADNAASDGAISEHHGPGDRKSVV